MSLVSSVRVLLVAGCTLAVSLAGCSDDGGSSTTNGGAGATGGSGASGGSVASGGAAAIGGSAGTTSCDGCMDGNTCIPRGNQSVTVCGRNGDACDSCESGFACASGVCVVDTGQCTQASCPSGCCQGGVCVQAAAQDWSACGGGGQTCGECTYGAECSGSCQTALDFSLLYKVQVRSVRSTESNGSSGWDAAGGLPDLFVCVEPANGSLGGSAACTPACSDSSSCAFNDSGGNLGVFPGASVQAGLVLTVYDEDVASDDLVASGTFTLSDVAAGGYSTGAFGGALDLIFELRQP